MESPLKSPKKRDSTEPERQNKKKLKYKQKYLKL